MVQMMRRRKRPRVVAAGSQKMETDQGPLSDLPPVPEDDDLHARVIEVMTDIEVLLEGSSVVDVFAVSSVKQRVIGSFSERQRSCSFNRGLIIGCLIWSRKKC